MYYLRDNFEELCNTAESTDLELRDQALNHALYTSTGIAFAPVEESDSGGDESKEREASVRVRPPIRKRPAEGPH